MATFEEHIEGLTQIAIESSGTAPTETELQGFLRDGVKDCINRITKLNPSDTFKFAKESQATNDNGITVTGKVLSVVRHHDSTSILRVCTPIPSQLRYEVTDVDSLHYRSKYNPGYYLLDGKIHARPAAGGSNNDLNVSQIHYDTGIEPSNTYNAGAIDNFPIEYEYLIALYAAAMACQTAASDIQNNMPTKPSVPNIPVFDDSEAEIPIAPVMSTPEISLDFKEVNALLSLGDLDAVEKAFTRIDKEIEVFSKKLEIDGIYNTNSAEVYKAEMDKFIKDADRKLQSEAGEYKSESLKYQNDINFYSSEVSEKVTKYKWYIGQYVNLMNQYNAGIMSIAKPMTQQKETSSKAQKRPRREEGQE